MAKKEKLNSFSIDLILKILKEFDQENLKEFVKLIQMLIENDWFHYNLTPRGIEFILSTEFKEKAKPQEFGLQNIDLDNAIFTLFKVIKEYVEEKGKKKIKELLPIKSEDLTPPLEEKLSFLENLIKNEKKLISFINFESFIRSNKLESIDYNVNIRSTSFYKETTPEFLYFPVGELNLKYFDQQDNKPKMLKLLMTKKAIKKLKELTSDFYEEFIIQEDFIRNLDKNKR